MFTNPLTIAIVFKVKFFKTNYIQILLYNLRQMHVNADFTLRLNN